MPAAHARVAEHHHRPLAIQQLRNLIDPVLGAAQGQVDHGLVQGGQLQLPGLAHIDELEGVALLQAGLQLRGPQAKGGGHGERCSRAMGCQRSA